MVKEREEGGVNRGGRVVREKKKCYEEGNVVREGREEDRHM